MSRIYHLRRRLIVPHDQKKVFEFFTDVENLSLLTPRFVQFRILTPLPITLAPGVLLDYRLRIKGVPVHWQTEIDTFDPPHRFSDVQLRGPYRLWHHRHEFREVEGGTEISDEVDYAIPLGLLGALAHVWMVRRDLVKIFDYREARIREQFPQSGTDPNRLAVSAAASSGQSRGV